MESTQNNFNFTHRLSALGSTEGIEKINTIDLMIDRAEAVLHLLSTQFEHDCSRVSDALMANAIYSIINEIADIRAITSTFSRSDFVEANQPAIS